MPYLSVLDNLCLHGRAKAGSTQRARHLAGYLEFETSGEPFAPSAQCGERQRVAMARAMMASPKLILADEPLATSILAMQLKSVSI